MTDAKSSRRIPLNDLGAQRERLGEAIDTAMARVIAHGRYILGPEVSELEERLTELTGAQHCVACSNGTDALVLALMAEGVGSGDAVIVPAFSFVATAEAVVLAGATPVFVDVDEASLNIDPEEITQGVATARAAGLTPRIVIAVDLFGLPADYAAVKAMAEKYHLTVLADSAQSLGGARDNVAVGALAPLSATSFFPAKPLGCYGDGGAVFASDAATAERLRSLRVHGQGSDKYDNVRVGMNARLDTLQAAILLAKIDAFPAEIDARGRIAARYDRELSNVVAVPPTLPGVRSAWAQYTIRTRMRDAVVHACQVRGIATAVYYRLPLNQQPAYRHYPAASGCARAARLANEVLSLPMYPDLDPYDQMRVVDAVRAGL